MTEVSKVLAKAVDLKFVARKEVYIPIATDAKIRANRTPVRREIVFYMKAKGKDLLLDENKTVRCLKTTTLAGVHLKRLFHDLLIVEVLIWWLKRYKVKQYWVEDELRSMGQNKADLRVLTVKEDGSENQTDCEIVVQNHATDIIHKNNGMMWFTCSIIQKDTIEDTKVHHGVVQIYLGGVPKVAMSPSRGLTNAEMLLVNLLRQKGGALTAGAVAVCLNRDRGRTSGALRELVRAGHLLSSPVQLRPGQQRGAPHVVYAIDPCLIESWADREFAVRLSQFIEFLSGKGIRVSDIDRTTETALVSGGRISKRVRIVALEDLPRTPDEVSAGGQP